MMTNMWRLPPMILLILAALMFAACGGAEGSDETGATPVPGNEDDGASGADSADGDDADGGADFSPGDDEAGGGDGSDGNTGAQPGDGIDDDLFVSNGAEVLGASAEQFQQEITSMEGGLEMDMSGQGMDLSADLDFAFDSPDKMYMSMTMSGDDGSGLDLSSLGSMEFLIRDNVYYMNVPFFGGWVYMPLDDLEMTGEDLDEIQSMLSTDSAFDYEALVAGLDGVEFVGEEELNGRQVLHYTISIDIEDAMASLGSFDSGNLNLDNVPVEDITGPINMDLWVGADDLLPYQVKLDMEVSVPGQGDFTMDMLMHVDSYNQDVTIPPAPEDAMSMEDLFGGLFGDPEGGLGDEWDDFLPTS